jgi:beta-mannosidase
MAPVEAFGPWACRGCPAGAVAHPGQLDSSGFIPATVPGTVAGALAAAGLWDWDHPVDLDAQDWWYRTTLTISDRPCHLVLDGLATLAEVWLDGELLLRTDNMFRSYRVPVTGQGRAAELALCFRSPRAELAKKRPRPRWKTALITDQHLRWLRTSLLGRIPGWSPVAPIVGPWRRITLDDGPVAHWRLTARLDGADGVVTLHAKLDTPGRAVLRVGGREAAAEGEAVLLTLRIPDAPLWWPHTHGEQPLLPASLIVDREEIACGPIGFRRLSKAQGHPFAVEINGVPIYTRGACWTVSDLLYPEASPERDLRLARDAGMNIIRVGGTMTYESDDFYCLCDELGVLVWQDFAFANMDYPADDPAFAANIEAEARQQLGRLSRHPSLAVLCGNSEVEQQAAMVGAPREAWRHPWFGERLPALIAELTPGTPFVPSSPNGGELPFHLRKGVAHYYGVGAYLRTEADVRKDDVAFTSECLGFANPPSAETMELLDPRWKRRVPRDSGAGWDFEDVRDFYIRHVFAVDPVALRSFDPARYTRLSRSVPGEMMTRVFSEWRSGHGRNMGGLVWFFKDLWPGAGWGVIDSHGVPKAAYFALRRVWRTRQIVITDEGLEGLHIHAVNETAEPLRGFVELLLLRDGNVITAKGEAACEIPPRGRIMLTSASLLDGFHDVTYAYRFGPPAHEAAVATLYDEARQVISEAFHFVRPGLPAMLPADTLAAAAEPVEAGYRVTLRSERLLRNVSVEARGHDPDDDGFHLAPGRVKVVHFTPREGAGRFRGQVEALNLPYAVPIRSAGDGA